MSVSKKNAKKASKKASKRVRHISAAKLTKIMSAAAKKAHATMRSKAYQRAKNISRKAIDKFLANRATA